MSISPRRARASGSTAAGSPQSSAAAGQAASSPAPASAAAAAGGPNGSRPRVRGVVTRGPSSDSFSAEAIERELYGGGGGGGSGSGVWASNPLSPKGSSQLQPSYPVRGSLGARTRGDSSQSSYSHVSTSSSQDKSPRVARGGSMLNGNGNGAAAGLSIVAETSPQRPSGAVAAGFGDPASSSAAASNTNNKRTSPRPTASKPLSLAQQELLGGEMLGSANLLRPHDFEHTSGDSPSPITPSPRDSGSGGGNPPGARSHSVSPARGSIQARKTRWGNSSGGQAIQTHSPANLAAAASPPVHGTHTPHASIFDGSQDSTAGLPRMSPILFPASPPTHTDDEEFAFPLAVARQGGSSKPTTAPAASTPKPQRPRSIDLTASQAIPHLSEAADAAEPESAHNHTQDTAVLSQKSAGKAAFGGQTKTAFGSHKSPKPSASDDTPSPPPPPPPGGPGGPTSNTPVAASSPRFSTNSDAPLSAGPIDTAGLWTILTLGFLNPILAQGRKRTLQKEDVPLWSREDATPRVVQVFSRKWNTFFSTQRGAQSATVNGRPVTATSRGGNVHARVSSPLMRTLLGCYGWRWVFGAVATVIGRWGLILTPLLIREFLVWSSVDTALGRKSGIKDGFFFDWGSSDLEYGCAIVGALVFMMILASVTVNHAYYQGVRIGCAFRTALMSLIYEKALRCSNFARVAAPAAIDPSKGGKPAAAQAAAAAAGGGTGQTVNLMANDTQQIFDASTFLHFVWVEPMLILGTVAVMYWEIGLAALAAGFLMLILFPVQISVARKIGRNRAAMVKQTDARVKILSEILQGIRVIKLYAWELPMAAKVQEVRLLELACVKRALLLKSFNLLTLFLWPVVVSMVTFIVYVALGNELTVIKSITILAFVNVLARPITVLPMSLIAVAEVRVSMARIEKFLLSEELQRVKGSTTTDEDDDSPGPQGEGEEEGGESANLVEALPSVKHGANVLVVSPKPTASSRPNGANGTHKANVPSTFSLASSVEMVPRGLIAAASTPSSNATAASRSKLAIEIRDGSFAWERQGAPTLAGVEFSVKKGSLVGIIGSVGSGKSSLLSAILGEMHPIRGSVRVQGRIAYMAQQAWIQNCTVRDNILFHSPFDPARYAATLAAACLTSDLANLPAGDMTEIGERGITMSGGQKARCLSFSSLLATPAGPPIRAGDVKPGTMLLGPAGEPVQVVACLAGRDEFMYRIDYSVGSSRSSHTVTGDHLVTLCSRLSPSASIQQQQQGPYALVEVQWTDRKSLQCVRQSFCFLMPDCLARPDDAAPLSAPVIPVRVSQQDAIAFALVWLDALERNHLAFPLRRGDLVEVPASQLITRLKESQFGLRFALWATDLGVSDAVASRPAALSAEEAEAQAAGAPTFNEQNKQTLDLSAFMDAFFLARGKPSSGAFTKFARANNAGHKLRNVCVKCTQGQFSYQTMSAAPVDVQTVYMLQAQESMFNGQASLTVQQLERAWKACALDEAEIRRLMITEINPLMDSRLERSDEGCRQSMRATLLVRPKHIIAFGQCMQRRWLSDVWQLEGVQSAVLSHDEEGRTSIAVTFTDDADQTYAVTVLLSPHPSFTTGFEDVLRSVAVAHGVPIDAALLTRGGCDGSNFVAITSMSKVAGGDFMGIHIDSADQRMLLADGVITHNCSLARAVYRAPQCDLYLLDDPFAAVDVHVGTAMFHESVAGILRGKTRVVVLNSHLHLLKHFDEVVVVESSDKTGNVGTIAARGTFAQMERLYPALLAQEKLRAQIMQHEDDAEAEAGEVTEEQQPHSLQLPLHGGLNEIKEEESSSGGRLKTATTRASHTHRTRASQGGSTEFYMPDGAGVASGKSSDVFIPSSMDGPARSASPGGNLLAGAPVVPPPTSSYGGGGGDGAQFRSAADAALDDDDAENDTAVFGKGRSSPKKMHVSRVSQSFAQLNRTGTYDGDNNNQNDGGAFAAGHHAYKASMSGWPRDHNRQESDAGLGTMVGSPARGATFSIGLLSTKKPRSLGVADSSSPNTPITSPKGGGARTLFPPPKTPKSMGAASPNAAMKRAAAADPAPPVSMMTKEDRASGSVGFNLYRWYADMAAISHVPNLLDVEDAPLLGLPPIVVAPAATNGDVLRLGEGNGLDSITAPHNGALARATTVHASTLDGGAAPHNNGGSKSSTPSEHGGKDKDKTEKPEKHELPALPPPAEPTQLDIDGMAHVVSTTWAGFGILLSVLFLFLVCQAVRIACDLWLTYWGQREAAERTADEEGRFTDSRSENLLYWSIGCAILAVGTFTLVGFRAWLFVKLGLRISDRMHRLLFRKLLLAPITTFYDVTPLGRILNRFSKDFDQVDSFLPDLMSQLIQHSFNLAGGLILSALSTPWFLLVLVPIFYLFGRLQSYFRLSSRELKRLEGVTRSPIFSMFGETLLGLATIRAFRSEQQFIALQRRNIAANANIYTCFYLTSRWLSLRLDFISNFLVLAVGAFGIFLKESIEPALIGLALLYTLQFTGFLQWTVRVSVDTENSMTSVERLSQYTFLPSEAPYVVPASRAAPEGWPSKGAIVFNDLKMRYRPELPWILKGVSCSIQPREKIGICGRTGSGKSSLMVSLFRIVEAPNRGSILIDGIDIATVGLLSLRSALSIIPQDPVLFSGTIRLNLDPFHQRTDEQLWVALAQVSLKSFVLSQPQGLESNVAEYGDNFSSGQKQLICIARALLRQSKIIVLDEATAAVDNQTDALIQKTIRESFADCTVLTIAHRLNTIMDSTRILVLDNGYLAEFDTPYNLLQNKSGIFANMVLSANTNKGDDEPAAGHA